MLWSLFLAAGIVVLLIWLAVLVSGFGLSAAAIASGFVYFLRHRSDGAIARVHLGMTITLAIMGVVLIALAVSFAVWLSVNSG